MCVAWGHEIINAVIPPTSEISLTLQWRRNGRGSVSNHQSHDCLLNRLFRRRSKKTSRLHVTGLCAGNSPGTGEFPAQMSSYAENVSIWWRHHEFNRAVDAIHERRAASHQHDCLPWHVMSCWVTHSSTWVKTWRTHPDIYVEIDMRFLLQLLLYPEDRLYKKGSCCNKKSHASLHVKTKQRRHIVWFHKHKMEPKCI